MFIKKLKITNNFGLIREINFHRGLNLIVDETVNGNTDTGNNIGKTTVLRLIDFCLGKSQNVIYADPSNVKIENKEVKDFIYNTNVLITLVLTKDFTKDDVTISRNFLQRSNAIRTINGEQIKNKEFEEKLEKEILGVETDKPSFRQIISHNIRYSDQSIGNMLKTLDKYATDAVYETLYLYLFGCKVDDGAWKQDLFDKLRSENIFLNRLQKSYNKATLNSLLGIVNHDIDKLEREKNALNINPNFKEELDELSNVKYKINVIASQKNSIDIKKELILEAKKDMEEEHSNIDVQQLSAIYEQANSLIPNLQHTFEELLAFHNRMVTEKVKFISQSLPSLQERGNILQEELHKLLDKEKELSTSISRSSSYESLEKLITDLNSLYNKKGEYESSLKQIESVEGEIKKLSDQIDNVNENTVRNKDYQDSVQARIDDFNSYFSTISKKLYGESYAIRAELGPYKKTGQEIYRFSSFNANLSSGKKLGEMTCFDIAYVLFARKNKIPHLDFVLHDKNELISDNQLISIAHVVNNSNVQFVAPILKDKLPESMNNENYFILRLSQHEKLFKI